MVKKRLVSIASPLTQWCSVYVKFMTKTDENYVKQDLPGRIPPLLLAFSIKYTHISKYTVKVAVYNVGEY